MSNKLHWAPHINNITSKASRLLRFLRRNLPKCPEYVKEKAYFEIVQLRTEAPYGVLDPHQVVLKKKDNGTLKMF